MIEQNNNRSIYLFHHNHRKLEFWWKFSRTIEPVTLSKNQNN